MPKARTVAAQVLIPEQIHQQLKIYAVKNQISLKDALAIALKHFVVEVVMSENPPAVALEGSKQ